VTFFFLKKAIDVNAKDIWIGLVVVPILYDFITLYTSIYAIFAIAIAGQQIEELNIIMMTVSWQVHRGLVNYR
jgi:hypothetical protein